MYRFQVKKPVLILSVSLLIGGVAMAQQQAATGAMASPDTGLYEKLWLPKPANPKLPTLFLVGDSTVRNGHADGAGGQWGWGEPLVDYFDPAKINVDNRAIGGRSSRSYIMENQWAE